MKKGRYPLGAARKSGRSRSFRPGPDQLEGRVLLATITVNTTSDVTNPLDSLITLREAIAMADAAPGDDTIDFNLPANEAVGGVWTISLFSQLTVNGDGLTIDGPGDVALPAAPGNPTPVVALTPNFSYTMGAGLVLRANRVTVQDLAINGFNGNGITVQGNDDTIQRNFIGTDPTGTTPVSNDTGIEILPPTNTLGMAQAISGNRITDNLISGNSFYGVRLSGSSATDNLIAGNLIGTDAAGTAPLSNDFGGVAVFRSTGNTIGGTTARPATSSRATTTTAS